MRMIRIYRCSSCWTLVAVLEQERERVEGHRWPHVCADDHSEFVFLATIVGAGEPE